MSFAPKFDIVVVNDNLELAKAEAERSIREFLKK
jgi:guanylate kinase